MPGVTPCAGISDTAITHTRLPRCWPPGEWMVPGVMPGAGVFDTAYTDTRPTKNHYYGRHTTKMKPNGGRNGMSLITAAWHEQRRQQEEMEHQEALQKEMVHSDSEDACNASESTETGDASSNDFSDMSNGTVARQMTATSDVSGKTDDSLHATSTQTPSAHRRNTPLRPPPGLEALPQEPTLQSNSEPVEEDFQHMSGVPAKNDLTYEAQAEDLKDHKEEATEAAKGVAPQELKAPETWTKICPHCDGPIQARFKFCCYCGATLPKFE